MQFLLKSTKKMKFFARPKSIAIVVLFLFGIHASTVHSLFVENGECKAWLVQSIPTDMPKLPLVPGVLSSGDVLRWIAGNSSRKLDIIAQYWQLVAEPDNPNSGDYGYSKEEMKKFGSDQGLQVYQALQNAAQRNVNLRIIQHSGVYPDYANESAALAAGRPNVQNITLLLSDWWGSGIVHSKVWISDNKDVYIGSANNDWKSLTQVKELGIYLVGCPTIAERVEVYMENLLTLSKLNSSKYTKSVWDDQWQVERLVPCWSHFLHPEERCRSPIPEYVNVDLVDGYPVLSDPETFHASIVTPGISSTSTPQENTHYLSFAPPELLFGKYASDEQAWTETIQSVSVGGTVRISTMDWLGQSQYASQTVYWATLSSAISEVVYSKHAKVQLLVAYWAHSITGTDQYLKFLLYTNNLCSSSKYNKCSGKVEIKYYIVPGFNVTGPAISKGAPTGNIYPAYTRVNHAKYAVSDIRAHIGTSNLIWDYFYTTAGVSFGTYNLGIVQQLQNIFDSDWNSPYSIPVEPLEDSARSS